METSFEDYSLRTEFEKLCPGKSYDQFLALFGDHFQSYIDMVNFYAQFGLSLGVIEEKHLGNKVEFRFDNGSGMFQKEEFKRIIICLFSTKPTYTTIFTDTSKGKSYVMNEGVKSW